MREKIYVLYELHVAKLQNNFEVFRSRKKIFLGVGVGIGIEKKFFLESSFGIKKCDSTDH